MISVCCQPSAELWQRFCAGPALSPRLGEVSLLQPRGMISHLHFPLAFSMNSRNAHGLMPRDCSAVLIAVIYWCLLALGLSITCSNQSNLTQCSAKVLQPQTSGVVQGKVFSCSIKIIPPCSEFASSAPIWRNPLLWLGFSAWSRGLRGLLNERGLSVLHPTLVICRSELGNQPLQKPGSKLLFVPPVKCWFSSCFVGLDSSWLLWAVSW